MLNWRNVVLWIAVLAPAAAMLALIGITVAKPGLAWLDKHDGLAAWLQAVGALISIVALAATARAEGRRAELEMSELRAKSLEESQRAEEREQRSREAVLAAARAGAKFALDRLELIWAAVHKKPQGVQTILHVYGSDLEIIENSLSTFPLYNLTDADHVYALGRIRVYVGDIKRHLSTMSETKEIWNKSDDELYEALKPRLDLIEKTIANFKQCLESLE